MIRKFKNSDINKVMDIWLKTNIEAHNFINTEYWKNNFDLVKNEYFPISETYIYEENEEIKGFISILNKNYIGALFVDLKYQSKGIGKSLIDYCKNLYTELSLEVFKENIKAIKFYFKNNFIIISEEKTDLGNMQCNMYWRK